MAFDKNRIASTYSFPSYSILDGFANLVDFNRSESNEYADELLARSDAEAMEADWEAVIDDLWRAIVEYERSPKKSPAKWVKSRCRRKTRQLRTNARTRYPCHEK